MSIENNMRRSPKLLCEVLKSKNVVCLHNYNVINSYLPFAFFFHFPMTMLLQLGVTVGNKQVLFKLYIYIYVIV